MTGNRVTVNERKVGIRMNQNNDNKKDYDMLTQAGIKERFKIRKNNRKGIQMSNILKYELMGREK